MVNIVTLLGEWLTRTILFYNISIICFSITFFYSFFFDTRYCFRFIGAPPPQHVYVVLNQICTSHVLHEDI